MSFLCFITLLSVYLHETTEQTTIEHFGTITLADELFTTESTNRTDMNVTLIPCSDGEWQCKKDARCIPNNTLCNGLIDCKDASDEYRAMCNNTRPLFGLFLHCSTFWSDYHNDLCHPVCRNSSEFCYYALLADNNEKDQALCILPEFPENGWYQIRPIKNATSADHPETPKDFWLDYNCDEPYVIVEEKRHECNNGTWFNEDDNRYCSEACRLFKNDNFTYSCPLDLNDSNDCKKYIAINTNVTVSRAPQTVEEEKANENVKNVTVEILCSPDKEFHISTGCIDAVDKIHHEFENPTMAEMTTYETEFNKFRTNEKSSEFLKLVGEFHVFEKKVTKDLQDMHEMAEKCDILLDLLLWHLQSIRAEETARKERED